MKPLLQILAFALATLSTGVPCNAQRYDYDGLGRPLRITYADGKAEQFTFDGVGNLTRKAFGLVPASDDSSGSSGCFIATAAYGSALDPHVQSLRDFREEFLRPNAPGRALIACYESVSPPIADWIREHERARAATRMVLTPIVYGVESPRTTLALILAMAGTVLLRRRKRSRRPGNACAATSR